jgi:hypothetical protein
MYTTHGHQIPGTTVEEERPLRVARCGGPGLCKKCSEETTLPRPQWPDEVILAGVYDSRESYPDKAIRLVAAYVIKQLEKTDHHVQFDARNVYVVWSAKTLQNWKALVSTTLPDGMYYEVTYNGDKGETYIDAYKKFDNVVVPD